MGVASLSVPVKEAWPLCLLPVFLWKCLQHLEELKEAWLLMLTLCFKCVFHTSDHCVYYFPHIYPHSSLCEAEESPAPLPMTVLKMSVWVFFPQCGSALLSGLSHYTSLSTQRQQQARERRPNEDKWVLACHPVTLTLMFWTFTPLFRAWPGVSVLHGVRSRKVLMSTRWVWWPADEIIFRSMCDYQLSSTAV